MSRNPLMKRIDRITLVLNPPPKETRLPSLFLMDDGSDYPGCEEQNAEMRQLGRRLGLPPCVYINLGPDDDGSEP